MTAVVSFPSLLTGFLTQLIPRHFVEPMLKKPQVFENLKSNISVVQVGVLPPQHWDAFLLSGFLLQMISPCVVVIIRSMFLQYPQFMVLIFFQINAFCGTFYSCQPFSRILLDSLQCQRTLIQKEFLPPSIKYFQGKSLD